MKIIVFLLGIVLFYGCLNESKYNSKKLFLDESKYPPVSSVDLSANTICKSGDVELPAKIEAENFVAKDGEIGKRTLSTASNGIYLYDLDNGNALYYNICITKTGKYKLSLRVSSNLNGAKLTLFSNDIMLADIPIDNTGNEKNFITITKTLDLQVGSYSWKFLTSGVHQVPFFDYFDVAEIGPSSVCSTSDVRLPSKIEAESFVSKDGEIGKRTLSTASGGVYLYDLDNGNALYYNICVPETGKYTLNLRVSSNLNGAKLTLFSNSTQLADIPIDNTGSEKYFITITNTLDLQAGSYSWKFLTSGVHQVPFFDYFEVKKFNIVDPSEEPYQRMFLGGLTCSWPYYKNSEILKELDATVNVANKVGLPQNRVGILLEIHSDACVNYRNSWKTHFYNRTHDIVPIVNAAYARGIPVQLHFFNTNTPGKCYSNSWNSRDDTGNLDYILSLAKYLADSLPKTGVIVQPMNENDSSTSSYVKNGVNNWWAQNWPKSNLLSGTNSGGWAEYTDHHFSQISTVQSLGINHHNTTDSGGLISAIWGNADSGNLNTSKAISFVKAGAKNGTSVSFFNVSHPKYQISGQENKWISVTQTFASMIK